MNLLKLLAAGAAIGVIVAAFRDFDSGTWLSPAIEREPQLPADETEPILGYDGMDQETLLDWLADADLDQDTLQQIYRYESAHRGREPVLQTLEDLL